MSSYLTCSESEWRQGRGGYWGGPAVNSCLEDSSRLWRWGGGGWTPSPVEAERRNGIGMAIWNTGQGPVGVWAGEHYPPATSSAKSVGEPQSPGPVFDPNPVLHCHEIKYQFVCLRVQLPVTRTVHSRVSLPMVLYGCREMYLLV